ncbi:mucin-17 [Cephus cinctus]|uniref:Mucin-17 n=1 Tax=Cephus cinctus TaxID=211228 RepID=A0AAJ7RJK3_CEPCN|nr:mucin-17 [Cephus cinctus]XP_024942130.1 mucin-17 [Cephus cinctus]
MIGRWPLALSLVVGLCAFWSQLGWVQGERWSRQVSNSDWIPLASPRTHTGQNQLTQNGGGPANQHFSQVQPLALPPALQQQYQQQLMQLQKTQESIQNLLLLQQQLRTQQQLLQAQAFLPNGLKNSEENKQALHQSTFANLQSVSDLAPEVLIPPVPSSDALPPVYPPQRFLSQNPSSVRYSSKTNSNVVKSQDSEEEIEEGSQEESSKELAAGQGRQYVNDNQRDTNGPAESSDENEEVQLVYVPAETLAQRSQVNSERGRSRKQYQHQNQNQEKSQVLPEIESSTPRASTIQQDFARQILQQLHREQLMKNRMVQEERLKEVARLEEEQKELDRQARLHQETVLRERELQRQREAEKQKELERLEEIAKQEELERIRELREKQRLEQERQSMIRRQEEAQRQQEIRSRQERERQMAELQAKEESEREARKKEQERLMEIERLAVLQRKKEAEIQASIEPTKEQDKAAGSNSDVVLGRHRAEALVRNPQHHIQHLTENTRQKSRVRGRQRVRGHVTTGSQNANVSQGSQTSQGSQGPRDNYSSGVTPSPSPNQPPLSVYMGHINMDTKNVRVSDVLKLLKDAKTISVLDSVGLEAPSVFVGPSNLDPPNGFAKFDLPYLSSIENNRVERKVDKLPFFVAPLSFNPPPGYSKIPFPAPHIGSVVVNTVDNELTNGGSIEESKQESQVQITDDGIINRHRIRPNPLIEPNSYTAESSGTTAEVTPNPAYARSTTPTYDTGYSATPTSGSRYRYRQFYGDNRPSAKNYESNNQANQPVYSSTTPAPSSYQDELIDPNHKNHKPYYAEASSATTTPSYSDKISGTQEEATKQQDLAAQLALINQELAQQHYNNPEVQEAVTASGNTIENANRYHSLNQGQILNKFNQNERPDHIDEVAPTRISQDTRTILSGPTQYTLPAELPVISSHLPGLVNPLLDSQRPEHQGVSSTSSPSTTTVATTTTTTEVPTTTHRIRGRQRGRVISTRPATSTQSPSTHSTTDRPRRPYSRSRSRFTTTTTEGYSEPTYQSSKSKTSEMTQRYGIQDHTRKSNGSSVRGQRYRGRGGEKNTVNSELRAERPKIVVALSQETVPFGTSATVDIQQEPSAPALNPNVPVYNTQDDYLSSTPVPSPQENYSSITESTLSPTPIGREDLTESNGAESWRGESSQVQKYRQDINPTENVPYAGPQSSANFGQPHLEDNPVNGFNYQAQTVESLPTPTMSYRPKERLYDREKISSSTETPVKINSDSDPKNYEAAALQGNFGSQPVQEYFPTGESQVSDQGLSYDNNSHPNKAEYPQRILSSGSHEEILSQTTTTTTTTTSVPPTNAGRQRIRGRVGGRVQQDSIVQTRSRDGQDEYVRFSPINQDGPRRRLKTRPRVRSQQAHPQVQTDENEYVRIQAPTQYQRSTTRTTTTSTTTTTTQQPESEIEYGFIRPPNFQPIHPVVTNYQTFVPANNQYQERVVEDTASGEAHPVRAEILKNRQTYQPPPRRATIKSTTVTPEIITTPRISSTGAAVEHESGFTVNTKVRSEEPKVPRTRGRIRRPGKKRLNTTTSTTTSTENPTDDNELPIDENYPRTLRTNPETIPRQDNLNSPNFESHGELSLSYNRGSGSLHQVEPNGNSEDFVINFRGIPNAELAEKEEYDQTQLASNRGKNYYQESKVSDTRYSAVTDIEGAESQWSSKLTRSSFQPSYLPNRLANDELSNDSKDSKGRSIYQEYPEIITAGPEVQSITVLVTAKQGDEIQNESTLSNHERKDKFPNLAENSTKIDSSTEHENISGMEDIFGKKMQEDATSLDTTIPTEPTDTINSTTPLIPTTITDTSDNDKTVIETSKIVKKTYLEYPLDRKMLQKDRTRRRRVRVRVRPASGDFVTAESHRYTSVVNSLGEDRYMYRLEQTTTEKPEQSILNEFFQEMLKTDKSPEPSTTMETTIPDVATTTQEPLAITGTILLPTTMNDNVQDPENEMTTPAESIILDTEDADHPKNHRSKWSEVQDLTKQSNLDYLKIASWIPMNTNFSNGMIVDTQVSTFAPETKEMSKSDVKVLSDYVKAIFERLKGEETTSETNAPMTTTERMVPEVDEVLEKQEVESKIKIEEHGGDDNNNLIDQVKSTTETGATQPMSTFDPTEDTTVVEIVSTTPNVPVPPDELTTEIPGTTTTESPLGRILRTSTTTKVSHMTEICYRGRCVMTKPKKEIHPR